MSANFIRSKSNLMKSIEIDDNLYAFIASQTKHIGESASDILHRLLLGDKPIPTVETVTPVFEKQQPKPVEVSKAAGSSEDKQAESEIAQESVKERVSSKVAPKGDLFAALDEKGINEENSRVENFLLILSALHQLHRDNFDSILSVKGRNRIYFSTSKDALLEAGSSTNPKQIPTTEYWVVTNNNTAKKVSMLSQVMLTLGYANQDIDKLGAKFAPELN